LINKTAQEPWLIQDRFKHGFYGPSLLQNTVVTAPGSEVELDVSVNGVPEEDGGVRRRATTSLVTLDISSEDKVKPPNLCPKCEVPSSAIT